MGYVKNLGKMRNILEKEIEKLLRNKFSKEPEGAYPLNIAYQCPDQSVYKGWSYAVEVHRDREVRLAIMDTATNDLLFPLSNDIEPGHINIEELATVADELGKEKERRKYGGEKRWS